MQVIERYTLPEMGNIWTDEEKYATWLRVEIAVCEVLSSMGRIPKSALAEIKRKAAFSVKRIDQLERVTNHDVISFLTSVAERVGPNSRYIHMGLTSTDLVDTAQGLQLARSGVILIERLAELKKTVGKQARKYRRQAMIGRTHGVHAEPITFGLKLAVWYDELARHEARLKKAVGEVSVGKISGAVGNYAHLPPEVERKVMRRLNLNTANASTQTLQRDRHAYFMVTLAVIASSIEKFAVELRGLQKTETLEVEEFFGKGQKGSSAMPHKKNPIMGERMTGLARVIRGYSLTAMENVALWHERDISHSGAERIILPDSTILLHYMFIKTEGIIKNIRVHGARMEQNIGLTKGLVFSQRVLLALTEKMEREKAYPIVQRNAMACWDGKGDFKQLLLADKDVRKNLTPQELEKLFDVSFYLKQVDKVFKRVGL
jgi:adenylosuccinate lyase